MDVSFKENILIIKKNKEIRKIKCESLIGQVLVHQDRVLLRYKAIGHKTPQNNILCLNGSGEKIWVVGSPDDARLGRRFPVPRMFVGMFINEEGELWAAGEQSEYKIDLNNGELLDEIYTK